MLSLVALLIGGAAVAHAADFEAKLVIRDHKFDPAELSVPAGTKIKLVNSIAKKSLSARARLR